MPVRALIFDVDGTLVDSMPAHARSWEAFRDRHALDVTIDEILRRTTGRTGVECIRELFGEHVSEARALELIEAKEADYRRIFEDEFREVPGCSAFLAAAHARGLKTAVASGGNRDNVEFVLRRLHPRHVPPVQIRGDMGLPGKPQPAMFLEAAKRLGVAPGECIVFEDAPFGIEAARRAGMPAVAICTTHGPEALSGPHVLAHARDFNELLQAGFFERHHVPG